jgi:ribosomal protein S27E
MAITFFWIIFAIAVGVWASNRGRSGFGWFLLSLVITPLLGFIFVAVSRDLSPEGIQTNDATRVKCPACAELVMPDAIKCKHCGETLTATKVGVSPEILAERQTGNKISLIFWGIAIVVLALVAVKFG